MISLVVLYFRAKNLFCWPLSACMRLRKTYNLTFSHSLTANGTIVRHRQDNFFARYVKMLTTSEAPTYIENQFDLSKEGFRFRPPTPESDSIRRFKTKSPSFHQLIPHHYMDIGPSYLAKRSRNRCEKVST